MVTTLLLVPYYDLKLIRVSTIVTLVVNAAAMIAFPAGFLKLHSVIGWIFTAIVYIILFAACTFISYRTNVLFGVVEEKGRNLRKILKLHSLPQPESLIYLTSPVLSAVLLKVSEVLHSRQTYWL